MFLDIDHFKQINDSIGHAVTASVGVATCTDAQSSAAELLARADDALYQAKSQGRNRHAIA